MKIYKCVCGKTFDNPQKFNGHKQGCKTHIENKYGSVEAFNAIKNRNHNKGKIVHERYLEQKEKQLKEWLQTKPTCKRCGKIMTEFWGSGVFCSRKCANSRPHSEETKRKISTSIRNSPLYANGVIHAKNVRQYYENPAFCSVCGKMLNYNQRNNKTCGRSCSKIQQSNTMIEKFSNGTLHHTVRYRYKFGTYKGVECDSSWELAFVIYCIDHNINFVRNTQDSFIYEYKHHKHRFFPDFKINEDYYEIKNYPSELTEAKIKYFPKNKTLNVLYYENIKKYLDYVIAKYGKDFYRLYDRNKPSWMDNI